MVPLLFLVATTTTSNSTGNSNNTQGKNNNKSDAPRHVRLSNTEWFEIATKSHCVPLQSSLSPKIWLLCILLSSCICLIIAFSTALLLTDHNELQQPRTVIYGLLCVCINSANSWLWLWLLAESPFFKPLIFCETYRQAEMSWCLSLQTKYCWSQLLNQACGQKRTREVCCCAKFWYYTWLKHIKGIGRIICCVAALGVCR